uniref:Uncharacterized protein n=1 Tax=Rousettus aegyptiacus TaxID=9407 RepID=A0A7J8FIU6_ROUAE|nr:hypothetical protein HJG63_011934 [Rousettus aegyptiacus]
MVNTLPNPDKRQRIYLFYGNGRTEGSLDGRTQSSTAHRKHTRPGYTVKMETPHLLPLLTSQNTGSPAGTSQAAEWKILFWGLGPARKERPKSGMTASPMKKPRQITLQQWISNEQVRGDVAPRNIWRYF